MQVFKFIFKFSFIVICIIGFACKKSKEGGMDLPSPADSIQKINRWILDSMSYYYLGSDQFVSYPSLAQAPQDFFRSLLLSNDPFSWISNGTDIAPVKSTYERFGFQYIFVAHPLIVDQLVGVITLVAPGSPAAVAGIKRGHYFSKINNQVITKQQVESMAAALRENGCKITPVVNQNTSWIESSSITFQSRYYEDRPVFSKKIFQKAGINTGYLFYNSFSEVFDKDILDAIDSMRSRNVHELILDLRYNPGGSVASAAKLAAAILGTSVNAKSVFLRLKGNRNWGSFEQSFEKVLSTSSNAYRNQFSQLSANGLSLNRIFILSGKYTASAAEMMVNNLKPYLPVVHIGEKTLGKNKAGLLIKDIRQPKQIFWFMQPMVFEIFNANNQGGYNNGIVPQHELFEYATLPLEDIGSANELLLAKAMNLIYGTNIVNGESLRAAGTKVAIDKSAILFNSIDKAGEREIMQVERP